MAPMLGSLPGASSVLGDIGTGARGRRRRPEAPGLQAGQQPTPDGPVAAPTPTFAQMQQNGQARPAPQTAQAMTLAPVRPAGQGYDAGGTQSELQRAVSQSLANPSRYDTATFNTLRDSATNDLKAQFAQQKDALETNLASRGLAASSFGANDLYSLTGQQDRALANMNSQLLQQAATTQASDRASAIGSAQGYENANRANELSAASLTGRLNGTDTLAKTAQTTQGEQFNLQQALNEKLGLGGLGVQQGQLGLAGRGQTLAEKSQAEAVDLQKAQLAQSGNQFGQSLAEQQAARAQSGGQFDVQQALAEKLGTGSAALAERSLTQQGQQFNQGLAEQSAARAQSGQQFGQTLAEQQASRQQSGQQFNQGLAQSGNQFGQSLAEQTAARLQQGGQFAQTQAQSGEQFGRTQGLAEKSQLDDANLRKEQLAQSGSQFGEGLAEQTAARLQQGGQFTASQAQSMDLGTKNLLLQFLNSPAAAGQPGLAAQIAAMLGLNAAGGGSGGGGGGGVGVGVGGGGGEIDPATGLPYTPDTPDTFIDPATGKRVRRAS